jgi:hypothetical protein
MRALLQSVTVLFVLVVGSDVDPVAACHRTRYDPSESHSQHADDELQRNCGRENQTRSK